MKKKTLSLILTLFCAFGVFGAAASSFVEEAPQTAIQAAADGEKIDYAGQAVLDLNADSQTMEVTVKAFIDGDTTHFNTPASAQFNAQNLLKARYTAVDTPESTGKIEPWGKKAANFTRSKLENATSIIIESDGTDWVADSTGERHMSWIWYKAPGASTYRNLNIELLQEGLALGKSVTGCRYEELCRNAFTQANALKLHVYSTEKDPDYFYGESIEIDLKELRLNLNTYNPNKESDKALSYNGKRVAFEGTVAYYVNQGVYVEDYDEETQMYYGIYVYYGFNFVQGAQLLKIGNRLRIAGVVTYYEGGGTYQVSDLRYNPYMPAADDIRLISTGNETANTETSATTFHKVVTVVDPENPDATPKQYKYAALALNTSISMKNLLVTDVYTTANGGDSDGAMTLTCKVDNKTITVRTIVLRNPYDNSQLVTADMLLGKTIDVTGIIDVFNGDYQIKILSVGGIKVNGEPLFTPPAPPAPTPDPEPAGPNLGLIIGLSAGGAALVAAAVVAVVFIKKNKNKNK